MTTTAIRSHIETSSARSAWTKGVKCYALELLDELDEAITNGYFDESDLVSPALLRKQLLNGAESWSQYSWGGCSLIYDEDIAFRLCNPTELKRTKFGKNAPNKTETWIDTQARALHQASKLILDTAKAINW